MEHDNALNINKISSIIIVTLMMLLVTVFFLWSSSTISASFFFINLLNIILIFLLSGRNISVKLVAIIYSISMTILVQSGWLEFDFIPQARSLLESNTSIAYWFSTGNPHAIRLLIAYPGYIISELFNVELNIGFTYYAVSMFILIYILITNIIVQLSSFKRTVLIEMKLFIAGIPLVILTMIMNGRLIAAYLGYTMLIKLFVDLFSGKRISKIKTFIFGVSGLVFTMVSSGTMFVATGYILFLTYVLNRKYIKNKSFIKRFLLVLIILSPGIYKLLSYYWLMIMKNINYFGGGLGGIKGMLNHGAGRFLLKYDMSMIDLAFFAIVVIALNIKYLHGLIVKGSNKIPIIAGINVSVYGLLFGYSAGLMMVPPLIILVLLSFER